MCDAYRVCIFTEQVRPFERKNIVSEPKLDEICTFLVLSANISKTGDRKSAMIHTGN